MSQPPLSELLAELTRARSIAATLADLQYELETLLERVVALLAEMDAREKK